MRLSAAVLVLLAAAVAASADTAAVKRKKHAAARADAKKKSAAAAPRVAPAAPAASSPAAAPAAAPTPAPVAAAPSGPPRDEAALAALGAALIEDADGLLAAAAAGPAAAMGLLTGDRVWRVDRAETRTRIVAAAARRAVPPEERPSLIVRRGLAALALNGPEAAAPPDFARGEKDLSAREKALAAARAARDDAASRDAVAEAPPLDWSLRADQAFWVRFPGGLSPQLLNDDEVLAEAATGLTTDGGLDFLAVPPRSRVWARVISTSEDGGVRTMRLVFYKMQPVDGRVYPMLGAATALAGVTAADLARVSSGGTIAVAEPLPAAEKKKKGKDLLLDENARLRVRFIDPVTIAEPPSWWRAGPGLWLKTASDPFGRRRFQITHVVAGRSAAAAGLKVGDILDSVGGRSSESMDFEAALDALYGAPGTTVKVSVVHGGVGKTLELTRGVKYDAKGAASPLPLPFETR